MSKWSEQQLREAEMEAHFNNGYSWAHYERKQKEEQMWQEYERAKEQDETPVFRLQDGTILEGEQLKTA